MGIVRHLLPVAYLKHVRAVRMDMNLSVARR